MLLLPIKSNQTAKCFVIYHSSYEQFNKALEILWKLIMHQIISRYSAKSFKVFPLGIDWSFITSFYKWRYSKENMKSLLKQLLLELLLPHKILRPWKMKGLKYTLHQEYYCLFWGVWGQLIKYNKLEVCIGCQFGVELVQTTSNKIKQWIPQDSTVYLSSVTM